MILNADTFKLSPIRTEWRERESGKKEEKINIRMNGVKFYHEMGKYVNVVTAPFSTCVLSLH